MKKNISINISGIIFHIEEDGYDTLKKYLDSINRYFSTFDDSAEILADIESRIAEIFLSKLNEGKQVITAEDVNFLITTMGSVRDFMAAEESEQAEAKYSDDNETQDHSFSSRQKHKQLFRDTNRKIMGGVCAGIAHYFKINPVWIRLLFALFTAAWGITVIAYIILWIIVPASDQLEDQKSIKKMYRDPENKVLAGVSTGVAAYFGLDIVAVRVMFLLLLIPGAIGLLIYVVLWIVLPEARSLTERMQMQGEPLTLSNIESNIKKGLNLKEDEEENVLTKILLFPFRAIALIVRGLGDILGPVSEVIRVAVGIIILLLGFGLILSVVILIGLALGLFSFQWPWIYNGLHANFPFETLHNLIPTWVALATFLTIFIPCLLIVLLGASVIIKRGVITPAVGWSMFAIFLISVLAVTFSIPQIVYSFKEEGSFKKERDYIIGDKTLVLKLNETGLDDYQVVDLTLRGYHGANLKLVETYEAQGPTKQEAIDNAGMVEYSVVQNDSILFFDSNLRFKDKAIFKAQRIKLTLYIPYNHPFIMEEGICRFISQHIDYYNMDSYTWKMTEDGLLCIDCPVNSSDNYFNDIDHDVLPSDVKDFDALDISGYIDLNIKKANTFSVKVSGPSWEKKKYNIYRSGNKLVIDYDDNKSFRFNFDENDFDEVHIEISMPSLTKLEASGVGTIQFEDVADKSGLDMEIQGPIHVVGEIISDNSDIKLTEAAEADLRGKVQSLSAEIKFASQLQAFNLEAKHATIEVKGASHAQVNVTQTLEMDEGLASDIDIKGSPETIKK